MPNRSQLITPSFLTAFFVSVDEFVSTENLRSRLGEFERNAVAHIGFERRL